MADLPRPRSSRLQKRSLPLQVMFSLDEIFGKKPKEVARLFRLRGLNPVRPYRARLSSTGIVIEQD